MPNEAIGARPPSWLPRVDPFIVALLLAAAAGALLPARGVAFTIADAAKDIAIALLFFLQGVRLQRAAVVAGMTRWRLQSLTLVSTFVLFPLLGYGLRALAPWALSDSLWLGMLFLCALPSTVQSSIAFTSIARGNVPAAICAATASNLIGIVLTPLLVTLLLNVGGHGSALEQIEAIVQQLLVPFAAGQLASRWLRPWALRHPALVGITDRGSIILVVYAAFSAAAVAGVWSRLQWPQFASLLGVSSLLLAGALAFTHLVGGAAGFVRADRIAMVFCGSKKSLATGVPMANILFPAATVGLVILPVMIFHQLQLIACSYISRRYADAAPEPASQA